MNQLFGLQHRGVWNDVLWNDVLPRLRHLDKKHTLVWE